jgi:predicted XRE-type DNA-binding protein
MTSSNMTTAETMKTRAQLDAEIADLKEALTIAVETAAELLRLGQPQVRNRQSLLTWSQLSVAVDILKREVHK